MFTPDELELINSMARTYIKKKAGNIESVKKRYGEEVDPDKLSEMQDSIELAESIRRKCREEVPCTQ